MSDGMSDTRPDLVRLLRWYPEAWRQRYGDELVALMEDDTGGRAPSHRLRVSVALAGLRERMHEGALLGRNRPPADRARAGALVVLGAWVAFVVAGASFAKASEHVAASLPAAAQSLPQGAYDAVAALGAAGAAVVVLGAATALPAFMRFVRSGGWDRIRWPVVRASVLSVATLIATVLLGAWAGHLSAFQRNGGDALYSAAFVAWALLVVVTLVQWTAVAVAAARRLELSDRALDLEATFAVMVTAAMVVMTGCTLLWWAAVTGHPARFFMGTPLGAHATPWTPQMALTLAVMATASVVACASLVRVVPWLVRPRTPAP
jgi:hypothetical protein